MSAARDIIWLKHFVLTSTEERRSHALLLSEHNFLAQGVKEGGVAAEGLRTQTSLADKRCSASRLTLQLAVRLQRGSLFFYCIDQHEIDLATHNQWCKFDRQSHPLHNGWFPPFIADQSCWFAPTPQQTLQHSSSTQCTKAEVGKLNSVRVFTVKTPRGWDTTHDMYMALGITQQANYAQSRSVKLIVLIGPLCLFPRRATFYSKRFPPSEGQEAAVCFYPPSKCLSFSADGANLESPRGNVCTKKKLRGWIRIRCQTNKKIDIKVYLVWDYVVILCMAFWKYPGIINHGTDYLYSFKWTSVI